jgi:hypothetical protein
MATTFDRNGSFAESFDGFPSAGTGASVDQDFVDPATQTPAGGNGGSSGDGEGEPFGGDGTEGDGWEVDEYGNPVGLWGLA